MKQNYFYLFIFFICCLHAEWFSHFFTKKKPFTLVIDAAGHAQQSGRIVDTSFESSINFTIAQTIKQYLDTTSGHIKTIINRTPTQVIAPLQNAQFAHKLNADFYIHICTVKTAQKPSITFYQFSYQEKLILKKESLGFFCSDELYLMHEKQSSEWGQLIKKYLDSNCVDIFGIYKIPFKPLMGINLPAIAIEIGINSLNDLNMLIPQLNCALQHFLVNK